MDRGNGFYRRGQEGRFEPDSRLLGASPQFFAGLPDRMVRTTLVWVRQPRPEPLLHLHREQRRRMAHDDPGLDLFLRLAVFRWVRTREPVVKAVITIGVLLALQSAASLIWKNNQYHLPIYLAPQTATITVADVPIGWNNIVIIIAALILAFGLGAFLRYTRFGRAMPAVSDSPTSASVWGVPVGRVRAGSRMLGSLVAAVAGGPFP